MLTILLTIYLNTKHNNFLGYTNQLKTCFLDNFN